MGVPAVAFSQVDRDWVRIKDAAAYAKHLVQTLMSSHQANGSPWLLNVNIPKGDVKLIKGVKVCRQAYAKYEEDFEERKDPYGKPYYWMDGDLFNEDLNNNTDLDALAENYVSIVPVKYDLTDYDELKQMQSWDL